ncbi:hypothetical protein B0H19DRAFT_1075546 [Mycena capillaripes]|nr:hypothetical protein B0H19DRAFT_1075546 [Mycena capillaripes]
MFYSQGEPQRTRKAEEPPHSTAQNGGASQGGVSNGPAQQHFREYDQPARPTAQNGGASQGGALYGPGKTVECPRTDAYWHPAQQQCPHEYHELACFMPQMEAPFKAACPTGPGEPRMDGLANHNPRYVAPAYNDTGDHAARRSYAHHNKGPTAAQSPKRLVNHVSDIHVQASLVQGHHGEYFLMQFSPTDHSLVPDDFDDPASLFDDENQDLYEPVWQEEDEGEDEGRRFNVYRTLSNQLDQKRMLHLHAPAARRTEGTRVKRKYAMFHTTTEDIRAATEH